MTGYAGAMLGGLATAREGTETFISGGFWGHVGAMLGQEPRVHLGLGTKAQMHTPFLGHVGALLGLCGVYVGILEGSFIHFHFYFSFADSGAREFWK